jgi:hypothetical protein
LLLGIGSIAANEFFTPVIIRRIFIKDMEARVPSSGDLQRRHFRPLRLDENVLAQHKQLFDYSCIPMSVEFVLKFLGKLPPGDFPFQENWGNRRDGSFSDFDGWTFDDVKFTRRFSHPRNNGFPLDDLFSTIENELASGRYVIVSFAVPSLTNPGETDYHDYVIWNRLPNGEFEAVTKRQTLRINDVRERVRNMKGTDILTYQSESPIRVA